MLNELHHFPKCIYPASALIGCSWGGDSAIANFLPATAPLVELELPDSRMILIFRLNEFYSDDFAFPCCAHLPRRERTYHLSTCVAFFCLLQSYLRHVTSTSGRIATA